MPRPADRTVLVTGASKGIGRASALMLDRSGFRVLAGVRREEDGTALAGEASGRLVPLILDVTDPATIDAAQAEVERAVGGTGLFGLVNNAGVAIAGPLEFLPVAEVRRQFEINVLGQLAVTQALLPSIRQARGRIVMMSSVSGRIASPFVGAYAGSKFALEGMSDSLRVELSPWGIDVVLIEPGVIKTPIWDTSLADALEIAERYPQRARELYGRTIDRLAERMNKTAGDGLPPERVARAVLRALTARRPRIRYRVGLDAVFGVLAARVLPDRLRDRLIRRRRSRR
jgi:NAD(P)-dependent dehydrogenase (short-subunit alcohol dehydrogenase family)